MDIRAKSLMCFDAEMSSAQFIRKQVIILNHSSRLKTREIAPTSTAFPSTQLPSTSGAALWDAALWGALGSRSPKGPSVPSTRMQHLREHCWLSATNTQQGKTWEPEQRKSTELSASSSLFKERVNVNILSQPDPCRALCAPVEPSCCNHTVPRLSLTHPCPCPWGSPWLHPFTHLSQMHLDFQEGGRKLEPDGMATP